MNHIHPDTQYQVHRSFQQERLAKSLEEKPAREPQTFRFSNTIIFLSVFIAAIAGYMSII
jgi:hypothetical protein